jgi:hypothetical protein
MKHWILSPQGGTLRAPAFLALIWICAIQPASGQATAFNYQGRLADNGSPATGIYDLQFAIYDLAAGGDPVATSQTHSAVAVGGGLFTVTLDFGANFSGGERWLEIAARTNGGGAFTTLTPRQKITAAPYAITAREVTGSVAAEQLTGTIQSARIGAGSIHSNHIALGSIHSNLLAVGAIHSNHIALGSIHSNLLAAGAIHSNHLALGSIHSNHIALGSIHSNLLAVGAIHSNHLALGSIHSNHIALGSIHSNLLALGAIHSNHLALGAIHSNHIALGSIHSNLLARGAIHSNHLAVGSIHSNHIALGSIHSNLLAVGAIHSNHLAVGSIHSNHIALGSIHSNLLAVGAIHSNHLAIGSIHSNHIALGSIHSNLLAVGAIHSNHLAVGSIHSNALAVGSVTAVALRTGSIHSNHLALGSVHSNALVFGSIHSNHLSVGAIHSNHLARASIHSNHFALGSIHSNHLAVGSIHSNHIAAGSIHSNLLAVGAIHSNHLAVGSIHSNALALGSVTAAALATGSIHSNHIALGSIHSNLLAVGSVNLASLSTAVGGSFSTTLNNPNTSFFSYFGVSVAALGSDKLVVGAYEDSTAWDNGGAAYLLSTSGTVLRTILSPAPQNQEHFGFAVATVGQDKVLIGADGNDTGALDAGAAYLFSADGPLVTTFTNPTPATSDFFGYAVAAVGEDKVLIGAYADHFGANNGGAAYLFTTNRTLLTTFNNPTPASGDRFGIAVAAVGTDKVLIGADQDDTGGTDAGVAYLFHINGTLLATLTNPTPANIDYFGTAVAAVGADTVLIGAPGDNSNGNAGGAAYLFNTSGALLTTLPNPTPASGDQFGSAVAAIGGDKLLIGAASDDGGVTDAGAAYIFSINGALWSTMNNPTPATGDSFGSAVAVVGDSVLIGAPRDDSGATDSGAVHLFSLKNYLPGLALDPSIGVWQRSGANIYNNGGNVGIGTSNPEYPLDVVGAVRISNQGAGAEILNLSTERSWSFRQLGSGASTALELASIGGGGNKNFVINTTGLVGIGNTSPQATLHVSGNNSHLRLHDTGRGNYWNIYTENHPNQAISGNLLFLPGPTVGAYGYIQKSTGTYFSSSDARLKTDIHCLSGVLDRVLQMRPVSYRFKSAPASATPALGFIAQEVEPLFPEVVDEHDGLKSLAYSELVPVTVGAIQELNRKLEKKLQQKETELTELKRSVDELKTLVNALMRKSEGGAR